MNRGTNIAFLIAVGVLAVAGQRLLLARPDFVEVVPSATFSSLEGEVISVEGGSSDGTPQLGRALVKLLSGERVHALVPSGCRVLPGQSTRLAKHGSGRDTSYIVVENGK